MNPEIATAQRSPSMKERVDALDWPALEVVLDDQGYVVTPALLRPGECVALAELYAEEQRFRSRVVMQRHAFGRGEYKYFGYPLPSLVGELRPALYAHLAPIANRWHTAMRMDERFPAGQREFLEVCHAAGQQRPTPLMLRYGPEDYCCLHQDLYGEHVFPFQAIFLLSQPGRDFTGGELLLSDSDPKRPGRAEVVSIGQGQAVVLAVNSRPVPSARGYYRVNMRHGVSRLRSGQRHTLGVIFHDAT